jgi:hypothetical protein
MADDGAQPPGGDQGTGDGTDSGLFNLDSVAPDIREHLEPHLKTIQGNVESKFREAADFRKQWSPYEEIGLNEVEPDQVKGLLEFANLAKDPEQFSQWWKAAGDEMGLFDKFGVQDDSGLELADDLSPEKIAELVEKQVAEKIGPVEQTLQQQEQDRKVAQANEEVASAMKSIRSETPSLFEGDEEHQEAVEQRIARLAYSYSDDSSLLPAEMIQKGFQDYTEMIGQGEKSLFDQKSKQPPPPEGAGGADTSPEKIASFDDPRLKSVALAKLKSSG